MALENFVHYLHIRKLLFGAHALLKALFAVVIFFQPEIKKSSTTKYTTHNFRNLVLMFFLLDFLSAKIEVLKCPKDPRDWKQTFEISPVGINEKVVVDLEMMCQCDCEKPGNPVRIIKSTYI